MWGINGVSCDGFAQDSADMRFAPFRPGSWWQEGAAPQKRPGLAIIAPIQEVLRLRREIEAQTRDAIATAEPVAGNG